MFVKLGARYVVVINSDGFCECLLVLVVIYIKHALLIVEGVIDKKRWLEFLHELEEKS